MASPGGFTDRRRVATDTLGFVGGFTAVFVLLGLSATAVGGAVGSNQDVLQRVSGALVMTMGLFLVGSLFLRAPWLYQERRFEPDLGRLGRAAPPVAGAAFGIGWTPCIGPVLASILAIAATSGRAWAGGTLLLAYSAGLWLPFLLTGLFFARMTSAFAVVRGHLPKIVLVSGISLAVLGALLVLGQLPWTTSQVQRLANAVGLDLLVELG